MPGKIVSFLVGAVAGYVYCHPPTLYNPMNTEYLNREWVRYINEILQK